MSHAKGVVTNYGEGATKREGGGASECLAIQKKHTGGGPQKVSTLVLKGKKKGGGRWHNKVYPVLRGWVQKVLDPLPVINDQSLIAIRNVHPQFD